LNLRGSYRALLGNAIEALSAAVEIYNKPKMSYREECTVILLINSWELLLKALLSKNKRRIYYPKERRQPYRTYSLKDALKEAEQFFPKSVDYHPTKDNILLLNEYRNNIIHFYNNRSLNVVIYSLAQTAIVNFRDVVNESFGRDITDEISLSLLPMSIAPPIDPIEFLRSSSTNTRKLYYAQDLAQKLRELVSESERAGHDTGRLFTVFNVHHASTKKVTSADLIVGVEGNHEGADSQFLVIRRQDPNMTHPYRESDIITSKKDPNKVGFGITIGGLRLTQHRFRAIVWEYDVKETSKYCWRDKSGQITCYSPELVQFLKRLTREELEQAVTNYKSRNIKVSRVRP
jgi:hypothetical protein